MGDVAVFARRGVLARFGRPPDGGEQAPALEKGMARWATFCVVVGLRFMPPILRWQGGVRQDEGVQWEKRGLFGNGFRFFCFGLHGVRLHTIIG